MAVVARERGGVGFLVREVTVGAVGTILLATLLFESFGVAGVVGAVATGLVFVLLGGPYGYAVGQVLVASVLAVPLDSAAFLPIQGALLLVCFGRLLGTEQVLQTGATVAGAAIVAGALLVTALGTAGALWQTSALLFVAVTVTMALFRWYEPRDRAVEESA